MPDLHTRLDKDLIPERNLISVPPIFFISISFALGIWLSHSVPFSFFLVSLVALVGLCILTRLTQNALFTPASAFVLFLIGILFGVNDQTVSSRDITILVQEGPITLEGNVVTVPETVREGRKETVSFVIESNSIFRKGWAHPVQVSGKVQVFLYNPRREIRFGDQLRLRGILEIPRRSRNPHSFDYAEYLARNGIRMVFRGIGQYSVLRQRKGKESWFLSKVNDLRIFLKLRIETLFPSPHHELANALILGFRKNIPRQIQDAFIQTGTAHLLAISGLNVSLIAGLFYLLNQLIGIGRVFNLFLIAFFIAFYTVLAGASFPVLRAGIMGVVVAVGFLIGEERNLKSAFFFAFFILLVFSPSALFQASFQLSFVAMASLIFILPRLEKIFISIKPQEKFFYSSRFYFFLIRIGHSFAQTLIASVAVTMGMFPILVWYFNLFSLVGFLANLFVVPVCTIGIALALALLALDFIFPSLAYWFHFLPLAFFQLELWLVQFFSSASIGYRYVSSPPWFVFILYYGFLFGWLFLPARFVKAKVRSMCLSGVAIVSVVFSVRWMHPSPHFTFFDLGKSSDAAYLSFSNGANCLVNTGKHFPSDQAYWILRPFFMGSQVQRLDSILLTKVDGSHAGGFRTVTEHVKFQKLWTPSGKNAKGPWSKYIGLKEIGNAKIGVVSRGDKIQFRLNSGVHIEILASGSGQILAFKVQDERRKILYLASVRADVFDWLMKAENVNDFDIVFIPHQEFDITKSEERFLARASPRFIVSNQREFLPQFKAQVESITRSKILFLEELGAIEFYFSQNDWTYKTFLSSLPTSGYV